MRTFIAIPLPQEIKDNLSGLQAKLKLSSADVKWVEPQNIHLTLKFLGDIDEKKINKIMEILNEVTQNKNSFHIRIASCGAFPKINYPRVIWVGADKGGDQAKEIAKELEEKIVKIGIPKEDREFSAHITIGRVRSNLNRDKLVNYLTNLAGSFKENWEFLVTKLVLFKSTLTPKGPIYEVLKEAHLMTT